MSLPLRLGGHIEHCGVFALLRESTYDMIPGGLTYHCFKEV